MVGSPNSKPATATWPPLRANLGLTERQIGLRVKRFGIDFKRFRRDEESAAARVTSV